MSLLDAEPESVFARGEAYLQESRDDLGALSKKVNCMEKPYSVHESNGC